MSSDPFAWFSSGKKTWELRKRGRQYTCDHVRRGRDVELRRGYSDRRAALWGEIVDVIEADSIEAFFKRVSWHTVLPESGSLHEAISDAHRILNIASDETAPVLGFKIELAKPVRRIGLKPAYLPLVTSGRKRSTIRYGAKTSLVGPALLIAGDSSVPIKITEVVVKRYAELTQADALLDGFSSLDELTQALGTFYPELGPEDLVSILHFELASVAA